jgi:hypothetical protein
MSGYEFYISPEDYATAWENGISPQTLNVRIRRFGWDKQRAVTQPPQIKKHRHPELREIAKQNGISEGTFYFRIRRGWDPEAAATTPLLPSQSRAAEARRIIPKELQELATKNGIPYATFYCRIFQSGWDPKRAATEPVWTRKQVSAAGVKGLRATHGGNPNEWIFKKY